MSDSVTKKQNEITTKAQQMMELMFPAGEMRSRQVWCTIRAIAEQLVDLEERIKKLESKRKEDE